MTVRFDRLLQQWYPQRDELNWVLGTVIATQKSVYRKAGAMMLLNSLGQRFGLLSGGCLEGKLMEEARRALMRDSAHVVEYDLRAESDAGWQQGIGCGGAVHILLQPLTRDNRYLGLDQIHLALQKKDDMLYLQRIDQPGLASDCWDITAVDDPKVAVLPALRHHPSQVFYRASQEWLATPMFPAPHLLIFGGGADARPLARLANEIGWQVSVADARVGYADASDFPAANTIDKAVSAITDDELGHPADAIVIMHHNITLDAEALRFAQTSDARYVGILGPEHRRRRVENAAGLHCTDFKHHYCGPAGIDIGAQLPETIALSILSECHRVIEGHCREAKPVEDKRQSS